MSIKILLADDSITIQKVVGIIFGGDDYSLTVVDNGKAAVEKAQEIDPDVLLIDALMPGMSGYEVCEAVRAIPSLAAKPIILLTGTFEKFDEEKAKSCGADDSMAKPFESQQIVTKVKEMLELGASRSSAHVSAAPAPMAYSEPVISAAPVEPPVMAEKPAANDIWEAFTPPEEPASLTGGQSFPAAPEMNEGLDVFGLLRGESEAVDNPPIAPAETLNEPIGSKWIPSEEETFEFQEESVAELPTALFDEPTVESKDTSFGDISFGEPPAPEAALAAFTEPEPFAFNEPEPVKPVSAPPPPETPPVAAPPATEAAPANVTEDQLRAAIAGASREIIERIVWEIVPDLAESMIREAIQKIRQGD